MFIIINVSQVGKSGYKNCSSHLSSEVVGQVFNRLGSHGLYRVGFGGSQTDLGPPKEPK